LCVAPHGAGPRRDELKASVFRLYRLLNVVHALTYESVNPLLPRSLDGYRQLGLLTREEVHALELTANRKRDTVITWIARMLFEMWSNGSMHGSSAPQLTSALRDLRGNCAKHHDMFVRNQPNTWYALMTMIVDYQVGLTIVGAPFSLMNVNYHEAFVAKSWQYLQFSTIIGVFLVASSYWSGLSMLKLLHNPFTAEHDAFNTDGLLGSTERCLYMQLRVPFVQAMEPQVAEDSGVTSENGGDAIPPPPAARKLRAGLAGVRGVVQLNHFRKNMHALRRQRIATLRSSPPPCPPRSRFLVSSGSATPTTSI